MSDLVERLRQIEPLGGMDYECKGHDVLAKEAADRIERLEAALRIVAEHDTDDGCGQMRELAAAALTEGDKP